MGDLDLCFEGGRKKGRKERSAVAEVLCDVLRGKRDEAWLGSLFELGGVMSMVVLAVVGAPLLV